MTSPALRLIAAPSANTGVFRLDGNPTNYEFTHPFKSRFVVVQAESIPQDLLTSLSIYNIDFRIETPEQTQYPTNVTPEPDLVTLCKTNAELADSNIALRLEIEALQTKNKALNSMYITLRDHLLTLAKTLEGT
jgi:hypothetical protein